MAIVIDAPKLLPIRITALTPKDVKNDYVYTYNAEIDVTAQLHSGTTGFVAKQYDGRDVKVGDYIATTSQGRILKIASITNTGPTRVVCVLMDEDQMNAAVDPTQFGESSIDKDDGILFAVKEGKPFIFPLPDVLPGGLTNEFATQIFSRFNYVSKARNINVEQQPHTFEIGETVLLTDNGWIPATTNPTGVVVKTDDDSFGVRLFGDKTAVSLPGDVGDVYYWDDIDRMLTKTPSSVNAVKLFQKIDSNEALLLGGVGGGSGGSGGGGAFSGAFNDLTNVPSTLAGYGITDAVLTPANYTDLTNKPNIPTDISDLTDSTNLLSSGSNFDGDYNSLTNKPVLFSGNWSDITGTPALFTGNYNDLYNKPTIPADLGDLTNNAGYLKTITSSHVVTALGYTPQNAATAFGGSYTDLTNKPTDISDFTDNNGLLGGGGGATTIAALTDVDTSGATAGQVLKYDGTKWVAAADATTGGGGTDADTLDGFNSTYFLDYDNFTNTPTIPADITDLTDTTSLLTHPTYNITDDTTLENVGLGDSTFSNVTSATRGVALGRYALWQLTEGSYNTGVGAGALYSTTTGQSNTGIGTGALDQNVSGNSNTALGVDAGDTVTGSGNVLLGFEAGKTQTAISNKLYIANSTTNNLITGDFSAGTVTFNDAFTFPSTDGTANQILETDGAGNLSWVNNSGGGGGATALGGLNDVVSTAPTNGQVLKWDSTNNTWAPADDATAGIGGSSYATESYVDQKLVERGMHFSGDYNDLTNAPTLFSGNFTDLNGKPTTIAGYGITDVPASLVDLAIQDGNAGQVLTTDGAGNFTFTSAGAFNGDYNSLINKPNLFSGDYNDLANKPYIPSIAGLASTNYVDQKADYGGDKNFLNNVEFRDKIKQKASTANTTGERESLVMAIETTDDVETEVLFSDNTKIEIADGTTAMVEMHIVGSSSIGQYGVKLQAIVHRAGTNVFIIGSPARETLAEYSTWTADLDVNTTSLKVTVTGSAATTVDWTVFTNIFSVIR